jgi:hypothetical protein
MNEEDFNSLLRQEEEYVEQICAHVSSLCGSWCVEASWCFVVCTIAVPMKAKCPMYGLGGGVVTKLRALCCGRHYPMCLHFLLSTSLM